MVSIRTTRQSNARFASEHHAGVVGVFAGAAKGIGAATLAKMVSMLQAPTFYFLGRSSARFAGQRANLENLSSSYRIVFLEAEVSLLSAVDAACKQISAAEPKVDFLYMSQGLFPLNAPQCTCLLV